MLSAWAVFVLEEVMEDMDEVQMNRLLMQKVGRKFYGHDTLKSKYDPQIPASAEREYVRTTNAYMAILKT